jgi:hypothetical protein
VRRAARGNFALRPAPCLSLRTRFAIYDSQTRPLFQHTQMPAQWCTCSVGCAKHWLREEQAVRVVSSTSPVFARVLPIGDSMESREALCALANDPGILGILRQGGLRVDVLKELGPLVRPGQGPVCLGHNKDHVSDTTSCVFLCGSWLRCP